jgi:hypothetical protein
MKPTQPGPATQPVLRVLVAAMALGIAGAVPLFFAGPQLFKDIATARWIAAPTLVPVVSNCTRWAHIVSTCTIQYVDRNVPDRPRPRLQYFVAKSWTEEQGTFLRSADDPAHVTITLGIEHMADRQTTFAAWCVLTLGLVGVFLVFGVRALRNQAMARGGFRQRM